MKNQRITRVLNFFAFNLLFFALYLNFIHQDANVIPVSGNVYHYSKQANILAENPQQQLDKTASSRTDQTIASNSNELKRPLN